jgi:hypothetical protein
MWYVVRARRPGRLLPCAAAHRALFSFCDRVLPYLLTRRRHHIPAYRCVAADTLQHEAHPPSRRFLVYTEEEVFFNATHVIVAVIRDGSCG